MFCLATASSQRLSRRVLNPAIHRSASSHPSAHRLFAFVSYLLFFSCALLRNFPSAMYCPAVFPSTAMVPGIHGASPHTKAQKGTGDPRPSSSPTILVCLPQLRCGQRHWIVCPHQSEVITHWPCLMCLACIQSPVIPNSLRDYAAMLLTVSRLFSKVPNSCL